MSCEESPALADPHPGGLYLWLGQPFRNAMRRHTRVTPHTQPPLFRTLSLTISASLRPVLSYPTEVPRPTGAHRVGRVAEEAAGQQEILSW